MDDSKGFECSFFNDATGYRLVFEDNGKVGYGYLLDPEGDICADVWIYNCKGNPKDPEWVDVANAPFANPMGFALDCPLVMPVKSPDELSVSWAGQTVDILIRGRLAAQLEPGSKPGWAVNARIDGPLAKVVKDVH